MATDQVGDPRFAWGETVRFRGHPDVSGRSGALAEVCDVVTIGTAEHAATVLNGRVGLVAYLIEFGDGVEIEVTAELLEKVGVG